MARRPRGSFTRGVGRKRETLWLTIPMNTNTIAAGSTAVLSQALAAAALALTPFTIVRTHLYWHMCSDQVAASEIFGANVGFAVVSSEARAVGVTAVPTPVTDQGSDLFFLWDAMYGLVSFSDATGLREFTHDHRIDSKAMRKVEDGQDVVLTFETPALVSSAAIISGGRMLIKLH